MPIKEKKFNINITRYKERGFLKHQSSSTFPKTSFHYLQKADNKDTFVINDTHYKMNWKKDTFVINDTHGKNWNK